MDLEGFEPSGGDLAKQRPAKTRKGRKEPMRKKSSTIPHLPLHCHQYRVVEELS